MSFELKCSCEISPGYCFELEKCKCNICTICFSKAHAIRGCKSYIECPFCEELSTKWEAFKVIKIEQSKRKDHSSVRHQRTEFRKVKENAIEHEIVQPSLVDDPKQYHRNLYYKKGKNYDSETMIISATGVKNGEMGTLATHFGSKGIIAGESNLEEIFLFLHKPLVTVFDEGDDDLNAFIDPSIQLEMKEQNSSLLHRCIHAFATQTKLHTEPNDTMSFRAQRASTFAATDIIRVCKSKDRIGKLQKFISKHLSAFGVHQGLWKVLNRFNLSISLDKNRRNAIKDVNDGLQGGLQGLDLHAIFLPLYDNLGFRVKKGYDQYTMIQWILITKQQLREMNLYPPENKKMDDIAFEDGEFTNKTYAQLRIAEHVWENICEETSFETILGLTVEDYRELGESVYQSIQVVLQHYNQFPKYEEAKNLLSRSEKQRWKKTYSRKQGAEAFVTLTDHFETLSTSVEEKEEEEERPTYDSNYTANNSQIDMPMHSDLNKKDTCTNLLDYSLEVEEAYSTLQPEEGWEDITPLYKDVPMYLLGDGNPTHIISTVIREQNDKYKDKVRPYTGGFHCGLEGHRKRGQIFGPSLLEDAFSCWRESEAQLKWVMNPGDPNQINAELVMYELAMNAAAVHSLLKIHGSRGNDNVEITPKMVVDHILKRAKEWPIVMVALIEMRFANLIFMLNESETESNDKLFRTVQKFFLRLFASTHCTKYVSMMTDFFVHWYCCSPAEKILFAKAIFTRKTKNNKSVFVDRFVELMMRDFRMWLGKHGTSHTKTLLERCAVNLVGNKQTRASARRTYTGGGDSEIPSSDDIEIDMIFCEAFVHAVDCNYFGEGPPRHIKPGPCCNRKDSDIEEFRAGQEGFSTVGDSKKVLNKEILRIFSIGEERTRSYFRTFAAKPDFYSNPQRSEKEEEGNIGVSLEAIHPLKVDAQKNMKIKITGATSLKYKEIEKAYTRPQLVIALRSLFDDYKDKFDQQIARHIFGPQNADKKGDLINKMIMLRKLMMDKDEGWKRQEHEEAKQKHGEDEDMTDIFEIIRKELENPFYSLEHGSKTVNIDEEFVFDTPSDEQSNEQSDDDFMNDDSDDSDSSAKSDVLGISKFKNSGGNILF